MTEMSFALILDSFSGNRSCSISEILRDSENRQKLKSRKGNKGKLQDAGGGNFLNFKNYFLKVKAVKI
jgi:hypothetical protein